LLADRSPSAVGILTESERHQILVDWNATEAAYPRDVLAPHAISRQAATSPDRTAVIFGRSRLTYAELERRSNQLARHLQRMGVGPGALIGVHVERSIDMLVALLGVMKTGAAYVPLDPGFPQERLSFMVEDASLYALITQQSSNDPLATSSPRIHVDSDWAVISRESGEEFVCPAKPSDLAYVLYTSGSTGKPKGVQITHRALANFEYSMAREPGICAEDVLLAVTTISSDIAGLELYLPLMVGAAIVLASRQETSDARMLINLLQQHHVTILQATPVTWHMLLDSGWEGKRNLKALCGGEALSRDLAKRLLAAVGELWNMYGPTETTIWSLVRRITPDDPLILIGHPIANTRIYILDEKMNPVPVGVAGELYIGGEGVSIGYLNRPELSRDRFLPDPFRPGGGTIYKTGDLARFWSGGDVECLGRNDFQVKLRGFRIELGEIESVLQQYPGIQRGVISLIEDGAGNKRLVAYLVGEHADSQKIRAYLRQSLPEYMVPADYVFLDTLPVTPNGKVDRLRLPTPDRLSPGGEDGSSHVPRNAVERRLAEIWSTVLKVPNVGIHDNFFDLGGHSLLAVRLMALIQKSFGVQLSLNVLLASATVADMAPLLAEAAQPPTSAQERHALVAIQPQGSAQPLLWVPGGRAMSAVAYRSIALQLGLDQPTYAFESRLPSSGEAFETVEQRAAAYIERMRSVQPQGPYNIAGFCLGGLVAYEMAQQLQLHGEQVALLALVNTYFPQHKISPGGRAALKMQRVAYYVRTVGILAAARRAIQVSARAAGQAVRKIRNRFLTAMLEYAKNSGIKVSLEEDTERANARVMAEYRPKPYSGLVILLCSATSDYTGVDQTFDPRRAWVTLAPEARTVEIPGDHPAILEPPYVVFLAEALRGGFDEARESISAQSRNEMELRIPFKGD
jgi:amino acid adenylation domain-containing protein